MLSRLSRSYLSYRFSSWNLRFLTFFCSFFFSSNTCLSLLSVRPYLSPPSSLGSLVCRPPCCF